MKKTTSQLPLEEVSPGMVVAAPILDEGGRVLLPAGSTLSEGVIASLERRDIASVTVEVEVQMDPAEAEARRVRLKAQLDHLFRHAGEGEEMHALYAAVLDFSLEHRS